MAPKKGFEFQFKNPVQDSGDALTNVLFINDTPSESDILRLEATAVPEVTVKLKPVDDKVVSDENYHFKLTCKPDTLALPTEIRLDASHDALWGMVFKVELPAAASADGERAEGDAAFYFLYKGTSDLAVTAANPLSLTLRKVGAASKGGTRPAITALNLNKKETDLDKFVTFAGLPGDYNLTENAGLDLLAPRNLAVPTLMAGFVSSDIVLNDGDTENYLLLRIVNTGLLPISLAPEGSASPSKLTLRFAADDNIPTRVWALANIAQVSSILIPGKPDSSGTDDNWPGKDAWIVTARANEQRWELKPKAAKITLAPDEAIEVPISKIVTGHATGRTALRIAYSGLPGFGDGELVAFIQKYPLVYAGQQVGVGTGSPSHMLTVQTDGLGIAHTNGTVTLTTGLDGTGAALGTQTTHDLRFLADSKVWMTLKTDGKLGIGTPTPAETLHVQGNLRVNGELKNQGSFVFRANTDKNPAGEDLARFMDKDDKQVLTLKSDGKLGIGTSSPSDKLTVETATGEHGITHTDGTVKLSTWVTKWGDTPDKTGGGLGTQSNHPLYLFVNGMTKMFLATDGNVGIGAGSPSEKLHVEGNLRVNGELKNQGPFVFRANTDKSPAGEDLASFMDKDGNTALQLKSDGRLWLKAKPFEVVRYNRKADNIDINTGYKSAEWTAVIAGFISKGSDDAEGVKAWTYISSTGLWHIEGDLHGTADYEWWIRVIFIRNELVQTLADNYG